MTGKVLLKPCTMRMTAEGIGFLVIIYDLESVAKARHAEMTAQSLNF